MAPKVSVPERPLFKPAEVCTIVGLKPYVLRSWDAEFPTLGSSNGKSGSRVYRRSDVQMVLRIKELVFGEGLTLGAARRKLESELAPEPDAESTFAEFLDAETRERLEGVKKGLRDILGLLAEGGEKPTEQAPLLQDADVPVETPVRVRSKAKPRKGKKVARARAS